MTLVVVCRRGAAAREFAVAGGGYGSMRAARAHRTARRARPRAGPRASGHCAAVPDARTYAFRNSLHALKVLNHL